MISPTIIMMIVMLIIMFTGIIVVFSCYTRCPADKLMIKYGRTGSNQSSQVFHGGGTFVFPIIQSISYMDLAPITLKDRHGNPQGIVQLCMEPPATHLAVERFMNVPTDEIKKTIATLYESSSNKEAFEEALLKWGYELVSYADEH